MKDSITGCQIWSVEAPQPEEGVSWSGACANGKASGDGVLTFWDGKGLAGRYAGEMQAGRPEGAGRLSIRDDEAGGFHNFMGRFSAGKPIGNGFLHKADGTRFIGELVDGVHHAKGLALTPDGWLVRGEFKDGKAVGQITIDYTTDDGEHYLGQADDGKRHGYGFLTATDDDFYVGEFVQGFPGGAGIYKGVGGDRYAGDFTNGKPNGFGTSIDPEGNVIQGRFVNGEPDGTILVTRPDGSQSVTEWKAGESQ